MRNSRVKGPFLRGIRAGLVGALGLFLAAYPARAADLGSPNVPDAPQPGAGSPAAEAPPPDPNLRHVTGRPGANDVPIDVGALGAPDTSQVGLIGQGEGGLSPRMWEGTGADRAAGLFASDPRPTRSMALQGLAHRLLLSEAKPPEGALPEGESFLTLRLRRLLTLGDFESIQLLSNPVAPSAKTDGEARVRTETFLITGDEGSACGLAKRMLRAASDPYWAKVGAFCDVRAGNIPAAELAVGLLKSQGYDDPTFYALYDWLVIPPAKEKKDKPAPVKKGKKNAKAAKAAKPEPPRVPPKGDGTALSYAMLRAAKLPLGEEPVAGRLAMLHATALESAGGSAQDRLAAATEAASYGAFPIAELRALYAQTALSPDALSDPVGMGSGLPAGQALALAYQSVEQAPSPVDALHRARTAYQAALARSYGPLFATLVQPALHKLAPDPALAGEIPGLVEVLLAAHDASFAYSWFGLVDERQQDNAADPRSLDHLANCLRIAQPSERLTWTPQIIKKQLDRAALQGSAALAQRSFEVRILQALGYAVPDDVAAALPQVTPVMGEGLPAFQDAVNGHRTAEAILVAFQLLGSEGPAAAPQSVTLEIVRGFKALGLEDDARAIGLEAALASLAARS